MNRTPDEMTWYHVGGLGFAVSLLETVIALPIPVGTGISQEGLKFLAEGMIGKIVQSMVESGLDPKEVARLIGMDIDVVFVDTDDPAEHGHTTVYTRPLQ